MSATIGTGERGTICARPSAASSSLQVQRTMSAAGGGERVDLRERAVDVGGLGGRHRLHRDRRVAADGARRRPSTWRVDATFVHAAARLTGARRAATGRERRRMSRNIAERPSEEDQDEHHDADRDQLAVVDLHPAALDLRRDPLVDRDRGVPAVERQQRQQVEQREEEVDRAEQAEQRPRGCRRRGRCRVSTMPTSDSGRFEVLAASPPSGVVDVKSAAPYCSTPDGREPVAEPVDRRP